MKITDKDKKALITGGIIGFAMPFVSGLLSGFGMIPEIAVGAISGAIISIAISKLKL